MTDIVASRLEHYAKWFAASNGFRFAGGAQSQIEEMAQRASKELFKDKLPKRGFNPRQQADILQAEAAMARFVSAMIAASRSIKGYSTSNPGLLGERTFERARAAICPFFPIC